MERGGLLVGPGNVVGIALTTGDAPMTWVHLRRHGDHVSVKGHGTASDAHDLKKQVGTRMPLAVALDGSGCVNRVMPHHANASDVLQAAFPGAQAEHLLFSAWAAEGAVGASMMRRQQCALLLDPLRQSGFRIVHRSLGPWGLLALRETNGSPESTWTVGEHEFRFNEKGDLETYERRASARDDLSLGDERIPATHALACSAAWEHLVPHAARVVTDSSDLDADRMEERARVRYERLMLALCAWLVLLLAGDALLRSQAPMALDHGTGASAAPVKAELLAVREAIAAREAIATELGLARPRRTATHLQSLLNEVPTGILLDRLQWEPLEAPLRAEDAARFRHGAAHVTGTCSDAAVLQHWMTALRAAAGVRDVRLQGYAQNPGLVRPVFQLELQL